MRIAEKLERLIEAELTHAGLLAQLSGLVAELDAQDESLRGALELIAEATGAKAKFPPRRGQQGIGFVEPPPIPKITAASRLEAVMKIEAKLPAGLLEDWQEYKRALHSNAGNGKATPNTVLLAAQTLAESVITFGCDPICHGLRACIKAPKGFVKIHRAPTYLHKCAAGFVRRGHALELSTAQEIDRSGIKDSAYAKRV